MPGFQVIMHAEVFEEHLALLQERLLTLGEPLLEIGSIVNEYIMRNFEDAPWPPLAPDTIRIKEELGVSAAAMLVRTGDMKAAATSPNWQISGGGRKWTAKLEVPGYSTYHFEGTRFMPRRDYALLPDSIEGDIVFILEGHLFAGMMG